MANVDIRVGKKDSTFFSANPTLVLKNGQLIYNETTSELFIGDGVTQLSSLVAINGGSSYTFGNGLTESGGTAKLGGTLTEVTYIDGDKQFFIGQNTPLTEFSINVDNSGNNGVIIIDDSTSELKFTNISQNTAFTRATSNTIRNTVTQGSDLSEVKNTISETITNNGSNNNVVITDSISSKGAVYASDYSANFTPESLVSKRYVDANIVQVNTSTIGSAINGATDATPNDTDLVMSVESSVAKKNTWTQIKAFLKTYFDTVYQAILVSGTNIKTVGGVSVLGSGDVATPTFTNPIVGTQTQGDNSTKAASTSYVDTAIGAITVRRIHNYQNTDSTTTGSTNETVLANLKVTGGAMGNNGVLSVESFQCKSGTAGTLSWKYYVSTVSTNTVGNTGVPTSSTQIGAGTQSATTLTGGRYLRKMANKNSASTQFMLPTAVTANSDYSSTSIARNAININTANDFYVVVTATLANSADTAILSDIQLNIDKP